MPGLQQWPEAVALAIVWSQGKHVLLPPQLLRRAPAAYAPGTARAGLCTTVFHNAGCIHKILDWQYQGKSNYKGRSLCDKTLINVGRKSMLQRANLPPGRAGAATVRHTKEFPFCSTFALVLKSMVSTEILWRFCHSEGLRFRMTFVFGYFFPSVSINSVVERENIRRKLEYFGTATDRRERFPTLSSRFPTHNQ